MKCLWNRYLGNLRRYGEIKNGVVYKSRKITSKINVLRLASLERVKTKDIR